MIKQVRVSDFYESAEGLKESSKGFPVKTPFRIFGADTETVKGKPHTFQIVSEGEEVIERVDDQTVFKRFMAWLEPRLLDKGANFVFFHNLRFDLTILFIKEHEAIYHQYNDITIHRDGYWVKMFYGRVNMALIRKDEGTFKCRRCGPVPLEGVKQHGKDYFCANEKEHPDGLPKVKKILGPAVHVVDSAAFCPPGGRSLAAALKIYGVSYKKMAAPAELGKKYLWDKGFQEYALNDARAEEELGRKILERHKEYDIAPCISLPQMAGKILRHHFFKKGERLLYPPTECRHAAELSYHAGKNGFYGDRGYYPDLYEYDINSAFPRAMKDMPQLCKGAYRRVKRYRPGVLGLYRITGQRLSPIGIGAYPIVYDHAFKVIDGSFEGVWVTGYEVDILRGDPHYIFKITEGWIFKGDPKYKSSPLSSFVDHFWKLKSETPKGSLRDFYKNILNSLYGKFAACRENRPVIETAWGPMAYDGYWDEDPQSAAERHYIAGALYHPFIASQITGYVRRELYLLEKRGRAIHAATDSIKSFADLATSEALGGIKKEVFGGCYLFRNKLYLHFAKDNRLCGHDLAAGWLYVSQEDQKQLPRVMTALETGAVWNKEADRFLGKIFHKGEHLCKYGLHGYKGSVYQLFRERDKLLRDGYLDYHYSHMVNLREGFRRGETVSDMVEREERLTLA